MSGLLWQKAGIEVDPRIQAFLAGADVLLDREFFVHDIRASRAHAQGLARIGVIDATALAGIERGWTRWRGPSPTAASCWTTATRTAIRRSSTG